MDLLDNIVEELNRVLKSPLYAKHTDVLATPRPGSPPVMLINKYVDACSSTDILEKRRLWFDKFVANIAYTDRRIVIKVLDKKWLEQIRSAASRLHHIFSGITVIWEG
jgi:hypothetical protein